GATPTSTRRRSLPRRKNRPRITPRRRTSRAEKSACAIRYNRTHRMPELPSRYESVSRLGAGGGGEVWAVRDRVTGRVLALKLLANDAGEHEVGALVREAIALSGLEGLGVPQVIAFGALDGGRKYMVRELVDGSSLEDALHNGGSRPWLDAVATACDQLTVVHRAGLLHGDIKPANVIVGADGRGT